MSLLQALILGVVEGLTEFLPISSTGHLILTSHLLGLEPSAFLKSFEIAIQLGAVSAVAFLYGRRLLSHPRLIMKVFVAFLPSVVFGLIFYNLIKNILFESLETILFMLAIGGIGMIIFDTFHKESAEAEPLENISYSKALLVGLFQTIAMIPGVSRAAATIIGGLTTGLSRKAATEFSFLLALPTMAAATALDLTREGFSFSLADFKILAIGFVSAFLVAAVSIRWLLSYVQSHDFKPFGFYRIALATLMWFIIF